MNNLIDRGLIECKGRLDAPGRPMLYGTTPDFLRAFGLSSIEALPQTAEEIKAMFARLDGTEEEADTVDNSQIALSDELLEVVTSSEEPINAAEEETANESACDDSVSSDDRAAEDDQFNDDM